MEEGKLICYLDGDALCIVREDFEYLAVSPAMFVDFTKKQIKEFEELVEKGKNTCECGHDYKEHNYNTIINQKFPGGKLLGDGQCLHWNSSQNSYCNCKKFRKQTKHSHNNDCTEESV